MHLLHILHIPQKFGVVRSQVEEERTRYASNVDIPGQQPEDGPTMIILDNECVYIFICIYSVYVYRQIHTTVSCI